MSTRHPKCSTCFYTGENHPSGEGRCPKDIPKTCSEGTNYHKYVKFFEDCKHPEGQCGAEYTPQCAVCLYNVNSEPTKKKSYFSTQVGGDHYNNKYDVAKFCIGNGYGCAESAIIKYAARHERKNGAEDIKKIIHYAQFILEEKYGIRPTE